MPVLPKSLLVLGASLQTARMSQRLKRRGAAVAAQRRTFRELTTKIAATGFGRATGVEADLSHQQFRARVPLHTYEQLAPYIERMKQGEADVLWPGRCAFYALSSGTAAGAPKWLPVTEGMLAHFRSASLDSLLFYTARVGHTGVFRGRHLILGGSTALTAISGSRAKSFEAYAGSLAGIAALNLPANVERHLYEPGSAIAQIADWPAKVAAIVARTRALDITLLAGAPGWLLVLADALRDGATRGKARPTNLQAIWPNLECLVHGGVPLGPFHDELRRAVGPTVNFHEVYPATEAFVAAQDADASAGLRLLSDAGIFFEFLPMADFAEPLPPGSGAKAVPLEGVRPGVDYALLLTTPAGLCRYVLGDVVRFVSTEPPRLVHVGRTKLQLNAFGERVQEKELTDSLVAVCHRHNWSITNFHVAPFFASSVTGQTRGGHEWWIELKPGTTETPTGPLLAPALDAELMTRNETYAARRGGGLEPPQVRLVMPGVFEHWMRHHGRWDGQNKMPRCRSDREVAGELTAVAGYKPE
jgi:hypothetical protein